MRKKLLLFLCVFVVLATGVVVAVLLRSEGVASRARCERVRLGMTQAEVETVLGGPLDYEAAPVYPEPGNFDEHLSRRLTGWPDVGISVGRGCWTNDDGLLFVYFDEEDRVVTYESHTYRRATYLDKLRAWLGF